MAFTTLPIAGVDLSSTQTAAEIALYGEPVSFGPLGTQTFANDGLRYVWAVAAATIAPSTTACSVNTTAFTVTATGGAYISPAVSMISGDYGWFGKASV
jgi:hypothetical protein